MAKVKVETIKFRPATLAVIEQANKIIAEYQAEGYSLTLRQLYYQFVSRDLIPNTQRDYSRLGDIISNGRRAGLIDWDAIEDRTRGLKGWSSWDEPADIVRSAAYGYAVDMWEHQPSYVEVFFEKDALGGIFQRACRSRRIPYLSCRGYTSDSELFVAAQRLKERSRRLKQCVVLHFGDHDPSGIDMTRDIRDRLYLFGARGTEVIRCALNMDQIKKYNPPPNPAKETDSRFADYRTRYGDESWELDALEPAVLSDLVEEHIRDRIDERQWAEDRAREERDIDNLKLIAWSYEDFVKLARGELSKKDLATLHGKFARSDLFEPGEEDES